MNDLRKCPVCSGSPLALIAGTDETDMRLECCTCGATMKLVGSELIKIYKAATVAVIVSDVAIPGATHVTLDIPTDLADRVNKIAAIVHAMGVKLVKENLPAGIIRLYLNDEKSTYSTDNVELVTDGESFYVEGLTPAMSGRLIPWSSERIPLAVLSDSADYFSTKFVAKNERQTP